MWWSKDHWKSHCVDQKNILKENITSMENLVKWDKSYFTFNLKIISTWKMLSNLNCFQYRFDESTIELLLWYEAIFGKEMWKHVIVETTFWSHSSEAAALRYSRQ